MRAPYEALAARRLGQPLGSIERMGVVIRLSESKLVQVCACGALVEILLKEGFFTASRVVHQSRGAGRTLLMVDALSEIALDGFLLVDQLSLNALRIFQVQAQLWLSRSLSLCFVIAEPSDATVPGSASRFSLFCVK